MEEIKRRGKPPTKLTTDLELLAEKYLMGGYVDAGDLVPSNAGLSCYLGIGKRTLYEYRDKSESIAHTIEGIQAMQEKLLVNGGLSQEYNATITKLMMANHGYSDKVETQVTQKNVTPTKIQIVSADDDSAD